MKTILYFAAFRGYMKRLKTARLTLLACICLGAMLVSCSEQPDSTPRALTLAEFEQATSGKSPLEVAKFVFENNNCNSCHKLGKEGRFGFTRRGEQARQQSEGCIAMLTGMMQMVYVSEAERTPGQRQRAARFQEFGCTFCHKVSPGRMGLTDIGKKLASLHMSCSVWQRILNRG